MLARIITNSLVTVAVLGALSGCNYEILKDNGRRSAKPQGQSPSGEKGSSPDALTFSNVQARVLEPYCYKCHGENSDDGDMTTYAKALAYVKPGRGGESELVSRLKNFGGNMPGGRNPAIPEAEAAFLKSWIDAGAPEIDQDQKPEPQPEPTPEPTPAATPSPLPVPTAAPSATPVATPGATATPVATTEPTPAQKPVEATWASINDAVIAPKCVMCHSGTTPKGDIDLTSYEVIAGTPGMLERGDSSKSLLFTVIEDGDMPPPKAVKSGKVQAVTAEEREAIRSWIDGGGQK